MTVLTNVDCTVIPDGFVTDKDTLNLSLVLSPRPTKGSAGFDLLEWPKMIEALKFEIQFGKDVGNLETMNEDGLEPDDRAAPDFGPEGKIAERATVWWRQLWADQKVFDGYVEVLQRGLPAKAPEPPIAASEEGEPSPTGSLEVQFYRYGMLAEIAKSKVASDLEFELLAASLRGQTGAIGALGLSPSLSRRVEQPYAKETRAANALALVGRETFADLPIGDAAARVVDAGFDARFAPALGGAPITGKVLDRLQKTFAAVRDAVLEPENEGLDLGKLIGWEVSNWNPLRFAERREPAFYEAYLPGAVDDERYDRNVFGEPVSQPSPTGSTDTIQPAKDDINEGRLGLAAFDYAMMPDAKRGLPTKKPEELTTEEKALATAERHAAALQAHPALRKFVRMIVDIRIPLARVPEALRNAGKGVVAVKVTGVGAPERMSATAFVLQPTGNSDTSIFEPCPEATFTGTSNASKVPSLPLDRGVVMLNIGQCGELLGASGENGEGAKRRFSLEVVDGMAGIGALRQELKSAVRAYRVGVAKDRELPTGSGLRTRGLMLLDSEAHVPEIVAQARAEAIARPRAANEPDVPRLYYAEDLVDGYRPDALGTSDDHVFSLAERKVSYDVLDTVTRELGLPADSFTGPGGRDHGYILASTRITREFVKVKRPTGKFEDEVKVSKTTSDHLFCWTGNNLGLPTPTTIEELAKDKEEPVRFPVEITYSFAPDSKGAILRVGGRYRYMLRARKLNGSSVSLAIGKSMVAKHALGDGEGGSYVYVPVEPPPPPVVLVPREAKLTPPGAGDEGDIPASQTMIVNFGEPPDVRYLVSPKIEFDLAEQQGQFDIQRLPGESQSRAEERALERRWSGAYRTLRRSGKCGSFPTRPGPTGGAAESVVQEIELLAKPEMAPDHPYFVDASLCTLGSQLVPLKATTRFDVTPPITEEETSFWARSAADRASKTQGFAPEKVRPILLEVHGVASGKSRIVRQKARSVPIGGKSITVSVLRVEIARGDTFLLETWANRTSVHAVEQPVVSRALARLDQRMKRARLAAPAIAGLATQDLDARERAWQAMTTDCVLPTLAKRTTFRLEHPVWQPLEAPDFHGPLGIGAVRRLADEDWAKAAASHPRTSALGGEVAYAWGKVTFDRKTTRRIWAEAIWRETDPALLITRTGAEEDQHEIDPKGLWHYDDKAIGEGRLFDVDQIPALEPRPGDTEASFRDRANVLDLVYADDHDESEDGKAILRNLTADFKTDKARRLLVRLVAVSRFLPPSASMADRGNVKASADRPDLLRALSMRPTKPGQALAPTSGIQEIWLPATRPPPPPRLMKEQGTLYERRLDEVTNGLPAGHRGVKLTHVYRCWLDRDWFASGEGELLAVVCRHPGGQASPWVRDNVSRWGSDMTMQPATALKPSSTTTDDGTYLDRRQIVRGEAQMPDYDETEGVLPMPTSGQQTDMDKNELRDEGSRKVALALLKPQFHTGVGRWYCDIELEPATAFRVHLKLSLARYQPNALPGCKLSPAVVTDAFLLHQPWTFSARLQGRKVTVTATGPTYIDRAPMLKDLKGRGDDDGKYINRPLIVAELERIGDGKKGPLPVIAANRSAVRADNRGGAEDAGWPNPKPGIPLGSSRWTMQLEIPADDVEPRHAVRISLLTAHANSEAATVASQDGPLIHLPEPLVVQIPIE